MRSTALAMVAPRAADRVLILGASQPALAAEIALITGLNGRTAVADVGTEARHAVEAAATKAGALVDFEWAPVTMLPFNAEEFDVVVLCHQLVELEGRNRVACCEEAFRVAAPKRRIVVIEGLKRPGLFGLLPSRVPGLPADEVRSALMDAGARAVRQLAEVDGIAYYESQ